MDIQKIKNQFVTMYEILHRNDLVPDGVKETYYALQAAAAPQQEVKQFYCKEWNNVGYVCEEQCTACAKVDNFEQEVSPEVEAASNIPDGESDWFISSETFTRSEVFKMLYTQRAMIQNDLKQSCWDELPETAKDIVLNPRQPKI
jgi:hypothetical protein